MRDTDPFFAGVEVLVLYTVDRDRTNGLPVRMPEANTQFTGLATAGHVNVRYDLPGIRLTLNRHGESSVVRRGELHGDLLAVLQPFSRRGLQE